MLLTIIAAKTKAACSPKHCLMKCRSPGMALQTSEFIRFTTSLIKESLDNYFKKSQTGVRLYARITLALMNSIIAKFMKKRSRILFD